MTEPIATALVSTWSSAGYLRGCLDDLVQQSLGDRLEILVIDACSPENEGEIVREYQGSHPNIRYVRSPVRESTSAAFDRGTAMARGRYLSTANTDDRHHPEFFATMVAALEQHPEFGLAYADALITNGDNETWQQNTASKRFAWPDYTPATALSCCLFGAQPVWRRSVHAAVGGWDGGHRHANDQDMFLRIARRFGAVHVRELLGLFLQRPDSVAGSGSGEATLRCAMAVFRKHRRAWGLEEVFPGLCTDPSPFARAAALFEFGNAAVLGPYTDGEFALRCWQQALALPLEGEDGRRVRDAFANNTGCLFAAAGLGDAATKAFAACADRDLVARNRRAGAVQSPLRAMEFAGLPHEVVEASRRTRGLRVDASGRLSWSNPHSQLPWDVFDGPNGVPLRGSAVVPMLSGV